MLNARKLAKVIYWANAVLLLAIGLAFVFAPSFFPFHGDVIQKSWSELDASSQTLYLGMMRTEGAGYLASAVAFTFLLLIPFRRGERWATWAICSIGITEHVPTLLANLHVSATTSASPPWMFVAGCIISLVFAALLSSLGRNTSGRNNWTADTLNKVNNEHS